MNNKAASATRASGLRGFTLVETMLSVAVLVIAGVAIGSGMVGAQRNSKTNRDSIALNQTQNSRRARMAFQRIARQAIRASVTIPSNNRSIDLPYYSSPNATYVDRFATLAYVPGSGGSLTLTQGQIASNGNRTTSSTTVLCQGLSDGTFSRAGNSVQMKLVFAQGTRQMTLATGAVMNN